MGAVSMSNALQYEDIPQLFNTKTSKKELPQKRVHKMEAKKSMAITDMSTQAIVWYLIVRHKFTIALVYGACITVAYLSQFIRNWM